MEILDGAGSACLCGWKHSQTWLWTKVHIQNLQMFSTSGKTTVLSFNLQETGQGLWKGGQGVVDIQEIACITDK
jgi:hypothetical protein